MNQDGEKHGRALGFRRRRVLDDLLVAPFRGWVIAPGDTKVSGEVAGSGLGAGVMVSGLRLWFQVSGSGVGGMVPGFGLRRWCYHPPMVFRVSGRDGSTGTGFGLRVSGWGRRLPVSGFG